MAWVNDVETAVTQRDCLAGLLCRANGDFGLGEAENLVLSTHALSIGDLGSETGDSSDLWCGASRTILPSSLPFAGGVPRALRSTGRHNLGMMEHLHRLRKRDETHLSSRALKKP